MKNVLIISSSLRNGSNSLNLALEVSRGASLNNNVELISLKDKRINFCVGCLSCQKTGSCFIDDDVNLITEKVKNADVLVFVTPIYYYEMSGQLKTLLDRLNPLYASDYKFKAVYMVATAAENEVDTFDKAYNGLKGWVDCFEKAELKGLLRGGGLDKANAILNNDYIMNEAYEFGKNI